MNLTLAPIFTDHMVLQCDLPVPVWGTAAPGTPVTVTFGGQTVMTVADQKSRWRLSLAPLTASAKGGELTVSSPSSSRLTCRDVLIGEVWLCSGQSNMEWPVASAMDGSQEVAAADFPHIRLLAVPKRLAEQPQDKPAADVAWLKCAPENIVNPAGGYNGGFSAVAYFFGRELHRRLGVPVGLINASWGGTPAEGWTSREALTAEPAVRDLWENYTRELPSFAQRRAKWQNELRSLEERTADTANRGLPFAAANHDDAAWQEMEQPGTWQSKGLDFSGIFWFRKKVRVPDAWKGRDLRLAIGATDKSDVTYFNGEQVGGVTMREREDAWSFRRAYTIPGRLVTAGDNVIAVRVHSDKYDGGMIGPAEAMHLSCPSSADTGSIPLTGTWRYAIEANYGKINLPLQPLGPDNPGSPTLLFNGMIAPLSGFAMRGVIWYQGESNVGRAAQYGPLFQTLIRDWRQQWQSPLAFHFVQLANLGAPVEVTAESPWAELREAQSLALALPGTGMAAAIDLGEDFNIHPQNKQEVGHRLALCALHDTYGQKNIQASGPRFHQAKREGNSIRVFFNDTAAGLACRGNILKGFSVAGSDNAFAKAQGYTDGSAVLLEKLPVSDPVYIRYGWADNPICNLYNSANLPTVPFSAAVGGSQPLTHSE
jgi:sialate O-acetylesterase